MDNQEGSERQVKVGLLGDRRVGKTFLAHKLTDKRDPDYSQTTEITSYEEEGSKFVYFDYPSLERDQIVEIGQRHQFDVLVLIFKGCDSFTTLYNFLEQIKEVIDACSKPKVKYYWSHLKQIFLVYTDFQSALPVQLNQLFPILSEEIGNFCETAKIREFALKKEEYRFDQLKQMIQEQVVFITVPEKFEEEEKEKIDHPIADHGEGETSENRTQQKREEDRNGEAEHVDVEEEKLNEERRSMIIQKIHKSFFMDPGERHSKEVNEPEAPLQYINVSKQEKPEEKENHHEDSKPQQQQKQVNKQQSKEITEECKQKEQEQNKLQQKHHQEINEERIEENKVTTNEQTKEKEDKEKKEQKGENEEKEKKEEKVEKEEKEDREKKIEEKQSKSEKQEKHEKKQEQAVTVEKKNPDLQKEQIKHQDKKGENFKEQPKKIEEETKQKTEKKKENNLQEQPEKKIYQDTAEEKELRSIAREPEDILKTNSSQPAHRPKKGMDPIPPGKIQKKSDPEPKSCTCLIM